MKILLRRGCEEVAYVWAAQLRDDARYVVEFVESVTPPLPRTEKWVLIVSTLFGCPVRCRMCDAGGAYHGRLTADEILSQVEFMVGRRYSDMRVPAGKFKVQFARMGEPALNDAVLEALERLPETVEAPGLIPSLSTIAPRGREAFFERLLDIKKHLYSGGRFQLQFSLHTTDPVARDEVIPVPKWSLDAIADYGARWFSPGDRKITLNFVVHDPPVDPAVVARHFDPARFLIKMTPLNPTETAARNGLSSRIDPHRPDTGEPLARAFRERGFDVILSIGETRENVIGSNCGQYVTLLARGARSQRDYDSLARASTAGGGVQAAL